MFKILILSLFFAFKAIPLSAQGNLDEIIPRSSSENYRITIDSIDVNIWPCQNVVLTKSIFKNSGSTLGITFYFKDDSISQVTIIHKSPDPDLSDMHCTWNFYFAKNVISRTEYSTTMRSCLGLPKDLNLQQLYGYNKYINNEVFLRSYIMKLLGIIKGQINIS